MDWQQINTIWLELSRPSTDGLNAVLRQRGIQVSLDNLRKFLRSGSEKEVLPRAPSTRAASTRPTRTSAGPRTSSTIRRTPRRVDGRTYTYVLLVQDIFTRFAWVELLTSRDQAPDISSASSSAPRRSSIKRPRCLRRTRTRSLPAAASRPC